MNIELKDLVDAVGIEPTGPEGTGLQPAEAHHLLNASSDVYILTLFHVRGQDFSSSTARILLSPSQQGEGEPPRCIEGDASASTPG